LHLEEGKNMGAKESIQLAKYIIDCRKGRDVTVSTGEGLMCIAASLLAYVEVLNYKNEEIESYIKKYGKKPKK
jgi:hypothetical protein